MNARNAYHEVLWEDANGQRGVVDRKYNDDRHGLCNAWQIASMMMEIEPSKRAWVKRRVLA